MKNLYFILSICIFLVACQGSKHFTKLAAKQEAAGLTNEAANSYYIALQKKRNNIDAQIGMKKTGQMVLSQMLNEFAREKSFGTSRTAVYAYHKARDYRDKIQAIGVKLDIAEFYLTDYENAKSQFLAQLYEEGTSLLEEEKYQEAEGKFAEIRTLDANYKDSKDLSDIAYLEPLYSTANKAFDVQHYREAYNNYDLVIKRKIDYKDAKVQRDKCIEKGTYTIALLPFVNSTATTGLDSKVSAYTLEALTSIHDPFLRVVDREHMQAILQEQKLQLSGVVDDATAVSVGQLVGAQAILTGTVLSYSPRTGSVRSVTREAYEAYKVKKLNQEDGKYYYETRYKPVSYTEYTNSSSCSVSFQYKLINLQSGEIIKTEIIEKSLADEVVYGKYDGNVSELYPSNGQTVSLNQQDRRSLQNKMSSRQEVRPASELSNDLFNNISQQMSSEIGAVVQKLVQ
jgi:curli biogenesis system outer membrane secretion channel CsgG